MKGNMAQSQEVRDLLAQFNDSRADNALPLGIDMIEQMRGKNNGYPRWMHKAGVEPVMVTNQPQEAALAGIGYSRHYRHQSYPCTLYRRNAATVKVRIGESKEYEDQPKFADFIETTVAKTAEDEERLKAARVPQGCSAWMNDVTALPELDEKPEESPEATIARLRGQIESLTAGSSMALPLPDGALTKHERRARRGQ